MPPGQSPRRLRRLAPSQGDQREPVNANPGSKPTPAPANGGIEGKVRGRAAVREAPVNAGRPSEIMGRPALTATYAVNAARPGDNSGRPALTAPPASRLPGRTSPQCPQLDPAVH